MKKSVICIVALAFAALCVPAESAVIIEPSNCVLDGNSFSFDFIINEPAGVSAQSFKTTIGVTGEGLLFEQADSEAVANEPDYWVFGNSAGAGAIDLGGNSFQFGDNLDYGSAEPLLAGDIVARYAFTWDGTVDYYTFTIDLNTNSSYVLYVLNESPVKEALQFSPGTYQGDATSFTVCIPEPATLTLLALGGTILLKKRKA